MANESNDPEVSFSTEERGAINEADESTMEMVSNWIPSGYRFTPTDEELIIDYLQNKILNQPLPADIIRHVNIYEYNPQKLTEIYPSIGAQGEWYFFTPVWRYQTRRHGASRLALDGYWKAISADAVIYSEDRKLGSKRLLAFRLGKFGDGLKTEWKMHEYRIDPTYVPSKCRAPEDKMLDNLALCRIYKKFTNVKYPPQVNQRVMVIFPFERVPNDVPMAQSSQFPLKFKRPRLSGIYNPYSDMPGSMGQNEASGCTSHTAESSSMEISENIQMLRGNVSCSCCDPNDTEPADNE